MIEQNSFRFAPELFEAKSTALEVLAKNSIFWLSDFKSIDVIHDIYGLEVEGISEIETAKKILIVLNKEFSKEWEYHRTYQENDGWVVEINKYPHPQTRSWLTSDDD